MADKELIELNEALDAGGHEIRSLLILRNCKLVFERYKQGIGRDENQTLYSVTKSISSTLVGAQLKQGLLKSVDTPVASLMAKPWAIGAADWKKAEQASLKNFMQMSSGLDYKHDPVGHPIYNLREDRLAVALSPQQLATPGTRFLYSDGDVSVTGAVIAAVADTDLLTYARKTLFDPLQMHNYAWAFRDRAGRYPGGWGLRLRPMDMLKVGQLYFQRGEWNGERIFDASYVEAATQGGPNKAYALHWWIGSHENARGLPYFFANGFKGQRIYVFPTVGVVVAMTASIPGSEEQVVMPKVIQAVVASVTGGVGPSDPVAAERLEKLQQAGFKGVIRIQQEDQDTPRRF